MSDVLDPTKLEPGKKYLVRHMTGFQRKPRESLMGYMGTDESGEETFWNARPEAGTQQLRRSEIQAVWSAADNEVVFINDTTHLVSRDSRIRLF